MRRLRRLEAVLCVDTVESALHEKAEEMRGCLDPQFWKGVMLRVFVHVVAAFRRRCVRRRCIGKDLLRRLWRCGGAARVRRLWRCGGAALVRRL